MEVRRRDTPSPPPGSYVAKGPRQQTSSLFGLVFDSTYTTVLKDLETTATTETLRNLPNKPAFKTDLEMCRF